MPKLLFCKCGVLSLGVLKAANQIVTFDYHITVRAKEPVSKTATALAVEQMEVNRPVFDGWVEFDWDRYEPKAQDAGRDGHDYKLL